MKNFEKEYFITKETKLWDELNKSIEVFGKMDIITILIRAQWATYYIICKTFFPEYISARTLDS